MPLGRLKVYSSPKALSEKNWETVQNKIYNSYPGMSILGWYGVRNGLEAMLTQEDRDIHKEHFIKSWQVIYLLDGSNGSSSLFCWDGDKLKLCKGYYEYRDQYILESSKEKLDNKRKLLIGLIAAIIIIFMVYLSGQYGGGYFLPNNKQSIPTDNHGNNAADSLQDNFSGGEGQKDKSNLAKDAPENQEAAQDGHAQDEVIQDVTDGSNHIVENYQATIDDLERLLEDRQGEIAGLKQEVESLREEIKGLEQEIGEKETGDKPNDGPLIGANIYVIQSGDNLYKISQRFYGTDRYSQELAKINRIKDQKALVVGDYLLIPSVEELDKHTFYLNQ